MVEKGFKYKYLRGDILKNQTFEGTTVTAQTCDSNFIKGNEKWITYVPLTSGGGVIVNLKRDTPHRLQPNYPSLQCHTGTLQDFEFMPFSSDYLATCSSDAQIKFWKLTDDVQSHPGLKPLVTLNDHQKRVNLLTWSPSVMGLLACSSIDYSIRLYDIQHPTDTLYNQQPSKNDYCSDLQFSNNSSLIGSTWRDKQLRIIDPRQDRTALKFQAHDGSKPSKFTWMQGAIGNDNYCASIGYGKQQQREVKMWDLRLGQGDQSQIFHKVLDSGGGVTYPTYDGDLGILFMAGKGDGMIRIYEYKDGIVHDNQTNFMSNVPGRSYYFLPKYALDTNSDEIQRMLKAEDSKIEQISFIQPKRQSGMFQEELYPDTHVGYSLNIAEWKSGQSKEPISGSLRPDIAKKDFSIQLEISDVVQQPKPVQQQQPFVPPVQKEVQKPVTQPPVTNVMTLGELRAQKEQSPTKTTSKQPEPEVQKQQPIVQQPQQVVQKQISEPQQVVQLQQVQYVQQDNTELINQIQELKTQISELQLSNQNLQQQVNDIVGDLNLKNDDNSSRIQTLEDNNQKLLNLLEEYSQINKNQGQGDQDKVEEIRAEVVQLRALADDL